MRVLVVEPAQEPRAALLAMLAGKQVSAQGAGAATTALAIAGWYRPNVVLLALANLAIDVTTFSTLVRYGRLDRVIILGLATTPTRSPPVPALDEIIPYPQHVEEIINAVDRARGTTDIHAAAAQDGEHRSRVRRRHDGCEQQGFVPVEPEQTACTGQDRGRGEHAERREHDRRCEVRTHAVKARRQAAVEQIKISAIVPMRYASA